MNFKILIMTLLVSFGTTFMAVGYPVPQNVKAEVEMSGDTCFVVLTWDNVENMADFGAYQIYCDRGYAGRLSRETSLPKITESKYRYKVEGSSGKKYTFAVAIANENNYIGDKSETVEVFIPNSRIPFPMLKVKQNETKMDITWTYRTNISDLKGFRLYYEGELIANESQLTADMRTFSLESTKKGWNKIEIEAITEYGILSQKIESGANVK